MAPKRRRVSKSDTNNNDHEMSTSLSIHEIVKGSHEYKIKGYSLAKGMGVGKYISSGKFTVGGHEWAVLFNPDGNTPDSKDYVSVFVQLVSPRQEVRALYEFKLLDQSGKNIYGAHHVGPKTPTTFKKESAVWYVRSGFSDS
ncbi:hypothetical protein MKW92_033827 [Papaver armeniacum]|nr:hypothetical protein MKW92_033827 [Papaver armeniacum]